MPGEETLDIEYFSGGQSPCGDYLFDISRLPVNQPDKSSPSYLAAPKQDRGNWQIGIENYPGELARSRFSIRFADHKCLLNADC